MNSIPKMKFGERQVADTLDGIRRDHRARYEWAAKLVAPGSRIVDFACGVGYGSNILANAGHKVTGIDRDFGALAYARQHWGHKQASFRHDDGAAPVLSGEYDVAVCFETVEHINDPRPLLRHLHSQAPTLLVSVPNEDVMPWSPAPGVTTEFHFRHYTRRNFRELLASCGWCPISWHGQDGPESEVEPNCFGRTLIAVCKRDVLPEESVDDDVAESIDAAPAAPKHVAILGLGPSISQYLEITKRVGGRS